MEFQEFFGIDCLHHPGNRLTKTKEKKCIIFSDNGGMLGGGFSKLSCSRMLKLIHVPQDPGS